jgi:hypothetical protein
MGITAMKHPQEDYPLHVGQWRKGDHCKGNDPYITRSM